MNKQFKDATFRSVLIIFLSVFTLLVFPKQAFAGVYIPLRWTNITRAPELISNHKIFRRKNLNLISLKPYETAVIVLKKKMILRLLLETSRDYKEFHKNILVTYSNGSGIFRSMEAEAHPDGRSFIFRTESISPNRYRIKNINGAGKTFNFSLFHSFQDKLSDNDCEINNIGIGSVKHNLMRGVSERSSSFNNCIAGDVFNFNVQGPGWIYVETIYRYMNEDDPDIDFQMEFSIDSGPKRSFKVKGTPDASANTKVDGELCALAKPVRFTIQLDSGLHRIRYRSDRTVYIRFTKRDTEPDRFFGPESDKSTSFLTSMARDRRVKESGVTSENLLNEMIRNDSKNRNSYKVNRLSVPKSEMTYYRDLLPSRNKGHSIKKRTFLQVFEKAKEIVPPEKHIIPANFIEYYLKKIPKAFFLEWTGSKAVQGNSFQYHIPSRTVRSKLRIIAGRGSIKDTVKLDLKFDSGQSYRFQIEPVDSAADLVHMQPNLFHAVAAASHISGMRLLSFPIHDTYFLGNIISKAAVTEVMLLPDVKTVTLSISADSDEFIPIALQYKVSKEYQLDEKEYLELIRVAGRYASEMLENFLFSKKQPGLKGFSVQRELENQWLSAKILFESNVKNFFSGDVQKFKTIPGKITRSKAAVILKRAIKYDNPEQRPDAIRLCMKLISIQDDEISKQALSALGKALIEEKEFFLAEKLMKSVLLACVNGEYTILCDDAVSVLEKIYQQDLDNRRKSGLYAAAFYITHKEAYLRELMRLLLQDGKSYLTIIIGMCYLENPQWRDILIKSSFDLDWQEVFEKLLSKIPDSKKRLYWKGQAAVKCGKIMDGLDYLIKAGVNYHDWTKKIQNGIMITDEIKNWLDNSKVGKDISRNWSNWHQNDFDSGHWKSVPDLIVDSKGSFLVHALSLNIFSRWFLSSDEKPVKARLWGPSRYKVQIRPLHDLTNEKTGFDGRIKLIIDGKTMSFPFLDNKPSTDLDIIDDSDLLPGAKEDEFIELNPGIHELEVSSSNGDVLVKLEKYVPAIDLDFVPGVNKPIDYVLSSRAGKWKTEFEKGTIKVANMTAEDFSWTFPLSVKTPLTTVPYVKTISNGQLIGGWFFDDFQKKGTGESSFGRCKRSMHLTPEGITEITSESLMRFAMANRDDLEKIINWLKQVDEDEDTLQLPIRLTALYLLSMGEKFSGSGKLYAHFASGTTWENIRSVSLSAGIRSLPVEKRSPESRKASITESLVSQAKKHESRLVPGENFVLTHFCPEGSKTFVRATFKYKVPSFLQANPVKITITSDRGYSKELMMGSNKTRKNIKIPLKMGRNTLRFMLRSKYSNHMVFVLLKDSDGNTIEREISRDYFVASRTEPLEINVKGPALIRINRLSGKGIGTSFRLIYPGWKKITFRPESNRSEELFRIAKVVLKPEIPFDVPLEILNDRDYYKLDSDLITAPDSSESLMPGLARDYFRLEGQDSGTDSFELRFKRRRSSDDDDEVSNGYLNSINAKYIYRKKIPGRSKWLQNSILLSKSPNMNPLLGLATTIYRRSLDGRSSQFLSANGWLQKPENTPGVSSNLEHRLKLSGKFSRSRSYCSKWRQIHSAEVFLEKMSMNSTNPYPSGELDPLIFTDYKNDHSRGLVLNEFFQYLPREDTEFWGSLSVKSNRDFNLFSPDILRGKAGFRKLFEDLELALQFRHSIYLKDDDRKSRFNRSTFQFDLSSEKFSRRLSRHLKLGLRLEKDLDPSEYSIRGYFFISTNFSNGRLYRDFRPGSVTFRNLKKKKAYKRIKLIDE